MAKLCVCMSFFLVLPAISTNISQRTLTTDTDIHSLTHTHTNILIYYRLFGNFVSHVILIFYLFFFAPLHISLCRLSRVVVIIVRTWNVRLFCFFILYDFLFVFAFFARPLFNFFFFIYKAIYMHKNYCCWFVPVVFYNIFFFLSTSFRFASFPHMRCIIIVIYRNRDVSSQIKAEKMNKFK